MLANRHFAVGVMRFEVRLMVELMDVPSMVRISLDMQNARFASYHHVGMALVLLVYNVPDATLLSFSFWAMTLSQSRSTSSVGSGPAVPKFG